MAHHKVYAENGRTVVQKVGEENKRIVLVDTEMNTLHNSVFMQNVNKPTESWTMKYDEILDKAGAQVDPTGTDEDAITDYVTAATAFSSASGSGAILYAERLVTSAELLAMSVTSPVIMPAPGPNKYYSPVKVLLQYRFGTVAYQDANNGDYFLTRLGLQDLPIQVIVAPNSRIYEATSPGFTSVASSRIDAEVLLVTDDSSPGYPNTGDGDLLIKIWYTLETY